MLSEKITSNFGISKSNSDVLAQLIAPCAAQFVSSPLHLLGMDLYNTPKSNVTNRLAFIRKEYLKTSLARVGRIFPAFGIGGVANKFLKRESDKII